MPSQLFNLYTSANGTFTESQTKIASYDVNSDVYNSIIFDTKRHSIWAKGQEYGRGSDSFDKPANEWTATIKGATWSRLLYVPFSENVSGSSFFLQIQATRGSVVYNETFLITAHYNQNGQIVKLGGSKYNNYGIIIRILTDSDGNCYVDIYDSLNSVNNTITQIVKCSFIGINVGVMDATYYYTSFTDDTTVPTNFAVAHTLYTNGSGIEARREVLTEGLFFRRLSDYNESFSFYPDSTDANKFNIRADGGGSSFSFWTNNTGGATEKLKIDQDGHLLPGTSNTQNIGSSSLFWHYLYTNNIYLNRVSSANYGRISFYSPSYYTWFNYMQNVGYASPTGANEITGTYVTSWALRSLIENSTNYGWAWESINNAANAVPDIKMELSSNTGNFWVKGLGNFDTITIRNTNAVEHIKFSRASANYITAPSSGSVYFVMNGKSLGQANTDVWITNTMIAPGTDLYSSLGSSSYRWNGVYTNGVTINGGVISITNNGNTLTMGSTNADWAHFTSTKPFYFGAQGQIAGNWSPYTTETYTLGLSNKIWNNIYTKNITISGQISSSVATGTAPFSITSTTKVGNLNADLWDDYHLVVGSTGTAANTIYIL